jgi:hypothetical protein
VTRKENGVRCGHTTKVTDYSRSLYPP